MPRDFQRCEEQFERILHGDRFITLAGGWDDEAQICFYDDAEWTQAERVPIVAVLARWLWPLNRAYWRVSKYPGGRYTAGVHTWIGSDIWADTPEQLADQIDRYFLHDHPDGVPWWKQSPLIIEPK